MATLIERITNLGINHDTPFHLRNKLRVFNTAVVIIICISAFYGGVAVVKHFYYGIAVTAFSVLYNICALLMVRKRHYHVAFHCTMWYGFIFLSAFSILFGRVNNSYYYFLFMPVVCNILFDQHRHTVLYLVTSSIFMVLNVYYIEHYTPYYTLSEWMTYLSYPNIVFAAILVYMGVRLFKQENLRYAGQIEEQKKVLEEKNHEITDSINYARKIQNALIPSEQEFAAHFREAFILFKPKDIVSGDFYWITRKGNKVFYATSDCTGHGVPGGFMTMLGISFLDEIINEKNITRPDLVLNALRERIIHTLKQTGTAGENKDGMDIVLCCLDTSTLQLEFACANNSLFVLRGGALTEYRADKQPCGFYHENLPFTYHQVTLQPGDQVYTFSDGFADQFGGPKGKKFKYKQLQETLIANGTKSLHEQHKVLDHVFESWRDTLEQIDDVLLIGIKV
ncbi:MAG: SpoIIE family protein phosphatase [Bacteroidetes bacterium]|nr:SpoIIE family protein phosphatase [Bacteroidota bacterium]